MWQREAGWGGQEQYAAVFGQVWRIVGASVVAFWAGEFVNSYVMARLKVWTQGRALWTGGRPRGPRARRAWMAFRPARFGRMAPERGPT